MEDELLDLVNEHDKVYGTIFRSQAYEHNQLSSLRAIWFFIRNEDGKFWIPRRHASKKNSPCELDGSAVGHVSSGETYEQSMIREVQEELNIDITGMPFSYVGTLTPAMGSICFIKIFQLQVPNTFVIDYNKNDFSEFYWLTAQNIIEKYEHGEKMRKTLKVIMNTFY